MPQGYLAARSLLSGKGSVPPTFVTSKVVEDLRSSVREAKYGSVVLVVMVFHVFLHLQWKKKPKEMELNLYLLVFSYLVF